jgi:L-alanine-DL-glutamate epimerase-like enolase superfamily enzyme
VSAPASATTPPITHASANIGSSGTRSATTAGVLKIPLPIVDPTSTATVLHSPSRRGSRSPHGSRDALTRPAYRILTAVARRGRDTIPGMESEAAIHTLTLRHPFGLSRGSVDALPTVLLRLTVGDQAPGYGEAAPVRYLGQTAPAGRLTLLSLLAEVTRDPTLLDDHPRRAAWADQRAPEHSAARAALDIAAWDRAARRAALPLYEHLGAPAPGPAAVTSYTIALDELDAMEQRAREASHLPILKIKLGRDPAHDRAAIRRIAAAAPRARLRVDANGGWSFGHAEKFIPELAELGVDLIEQPLPRGAHDQLHLLRGRGPLIFADEDVQGLSSLLALRGRVDGINIKLMKAGGITPALDMIAFARAEGWKILLGCMIETRIGLSAAAQLAGLVDALDLDAHLLTIDDPVPPGSAAALSPALPLSRGLGLAAELPPARELHRRSVRPV